MKIEKQVCSLQASERLYKLGLSNLLDCQYMYVDFETESGHEFALSTPVLIGDNSWFIVQEKVSEQMQRELDDETLNACGCIYAAFTVAELLQMLPDEVLANSNVRFANLIIRKEYNEWTIGYDVDCATEGGYGPTIKEMYYASFSGDNLADVLAEQLIFLLEKAIITPNDCNGRLIA